MPMVKGNHWDQNTVSQDSQVCPISYWFRIGSNALKALKWFKADGTFDPYEGGRDLDALVSL